MRELETERLFLRKFHEEDLEDAYKNWASSKKIAGCFDYKKHESKEESKVMIASLRNEFANGEPVWVLECKKTGKAIGYIRIVLENERKCNMSAFIIGEKYEKEGYLEEALERVIKFLIIEKGYDILSTYFFDYDEELTKFNESVLEKVNMQKEAVLRNRKVNKENGKMISKIIYSVIKEDLMKKAV